MDGWKIIINQHPGKITRGIYILRKATGGTEYLQPEGNIKLVKYGEYKKQPEPFVELEPELLQELADALSNVGYKPEKGRTEGKLEATERHLSDMRQLLKLK